MSMASDAKYFLQGLESGSLNSMNAFRASESLDPFMLYIVIRFLREKYPPHAPQSAGVVERLIDISSNYPELVKKTQKGEKDPLSEWFNDSYSMSEFYGDIDPLIDMVVEKIEA